MESDPTTGDSVHSDERLVEEEAAKAAQEAARIGGNPGGDYGVDEEEVPLAEAGEGAAEGFEQAERELVENASHEAEANPDPTHLAGEPEDARTGVEYAEPDEEDAEDA